jgi:hypothetical protein
MSGADSVWEAIRTRYWPCFGWVHEPNPDENVATLELTETAIEFLLRDMGFRRNPAAWLKTRGWTPVDSDGVSEGSWAYREGLFAPMQLHVTLFSNDDGTHDLYAHYEPNWIRYPGRHLDQVGLYFPEAAARQVRMMFEEKGFELMSGRTWH